MLVSRKARGWWGKGKGDYSSNSYFSNAAFELGPGLDAKSGSGEKKQYEPIAFMVRGHREGMYTSN